MSPVLCPKCDAADFPPEYADRIPIYSEHYFDVQLGHRRGGPEVDMQHVLFEGEDVLEHAECCLAGEHGWVVTYWRFGNSHNACPHCQKEALRVVHRGNVVVDAVLHPPRSREATA